MKDLIKKLLAEGKSQEEIKTAIVEALAKKEVEAVEDIKSVIVEAMQEVEAAKSIGEAFGSIESDKKSAGLEAKIKELEAKVDGVKMSGSLNSGVVVKNADVQWKKDVVDAIHLHCKLKKEGYLSQKEMGLVSSIKERVVNATKAVSDGMITGTDAAGGYLIRPEFDAEIDKLLYTKSALLDSMKIRSGNEKTLINGIGTFDFSYRATDNAAFGQTRPTITEQEINYRDAGCVVPMAAKLLDMADYNIISEIVEGAADAKIRLLEPQILVASVDVDLDPFDGVRFHTGVTALNCKNYDGSKKLESIDLTNAFLAAPAQSRSNGMFFMDSRELMLLLEEKATDGHYQKAVEIVNGAFIHMATGKKIVAVDTLHRLLNGVTDRSTQNEVAVIFADMSRFRFYQKGGLRIDTSKDIFFLEDQIALRFILTNKQGIPTNSRSSFVTIQGVEYNAAT